MNEYLAQAISEVNNLNEVTTNKDLRISVLGKNSFHQPIFKKLK